MAFAMKMRFVDVVCDDSLRHYYAGGRKMGYQFEIRLGYYRGHFLSVIDEFAVAVDGEHTIDVKLMFRSPYMAIGPDHAYMPVDSSGSKTLTITD